MASLTDKRIKNTYDGLLKTTDNDPLGGSYKLITDGFGNSSNVYLGTGGAVGIGQGSPRGKFDVDGEVYVTTPNGIDSLKISDLSVKIGDYDDANGYAFLHLDSQDFKFTTDSVEVMRITSSGNVGIGTTSPGEKLSVSPGDNVSAEIGKSLVGNIGLSGYAGFKHQSLSSSTSYALLQSSTGETFLNASSTQSIGFRIGNSDKMTLTSGGNVGIGTTSPSTKLDVNGNAKFNGETYIRSTSNVGIRIQTSDQGLTSSDGLRVGLNSVHAFVWQYETLPLSFATSGVERLRIDSSGNIGIGTTSPQAGLHVNNNSFLVTSGSEKSVDIDSLTYIYKIGDIDGGESGSYMEIKGVDGDTIFHNTNVGIGTTSPARNLHIHQNDSTLSYLQITNSTTGASGSDGVSFGITSDEVAVWNNRENTDTTISTNNTERLRITNGGNVGIGTTSPVKKLEVNGEIQGTNLYAETYRSSRSDGDIYIQATAATDFVAIGTQASPSLMKIQGDGSVGIGTTSPSVVGGTAKMTIDVGSGVKPVSIVNGTTDGMYIRRYSTGGSYQLQTTVGSGNAGNLSLQSYDGNVGIGTTSPDSKLQVNPSSTSDVAINANGRLKIIGNGTMKWGSSAGHGELSWDSGYALYKGQSGNGMKLQVNGTTTVMTLNTSGNVGIGTTSPDVKLEINGGADAKAKITGTTIAARFDFETNSHHRFWQLIESDGRFRFYDQTNGSERFTIDTSGNVGIGTTSPGSLLSIATYAGTGHINESTLPTTPDKHLINLAPPSTLNYFGGGISWSEGTNTAASINAIDNGSGGALGLILSTGNNTSISERMRIDSSGNIGIGTTSPGQKLHVAGNIRVGDSTDTIYSNRFKGINNADVELRANNGYDLILNGSSGDNVGIGASNPLAKLQINGENAGSVFDALLLINKSTTAGTSTKLKFVNSTDASAAPNTNYINSVRNAGSDNDLIFGTSNSDRMTIDSSGNVGIGTTSPNTTLEVAGVTTISASTTNALFVNNSANSTAAIGTTNTYLSINANNYIVLNSTTLNYHGIWTVNNKPYRFQETDGTWVDILNLSGTDNVLKFGTITDVSTGGDIAFYADNSEKMRIDSSGNVGIGTTSPGVKLDVDGDVRVSLFSKFTFANGQYIKDDGSAGLDIASISASGTINFITNSTDKMIIDSSGNVGIGTTSPSTKLDVNGSINASGDLTLTDINPSIILTDTNSDSDFSINVNGGVFNIKDDTNNLSRINLKSNGNVGIGTASPQAKLEVGDCDTSGNIADGNIAVKTNTNDTAIVIQEASGAEQWGLGVNADGDLIFTDSGTEKIRFDDGTGNVGIGTSSPSQKLHVKDDDATLLLQDSTTGFASQASGIILTCSDGSGNPRTDVQYKLKVNSTSFEITYGSSNAQRFKIESDGGIFVPSLLGSSASNPDVRYDTTTGELYYNSSSIRYKEDVTDIESTIDKINKLRPVKFKVKESQQYTTGLIAEEVVEVIPEIVFEREIEGFDKPQIDGVAYNDLHAYYIKAIQEQQQMINDLKRRIEVLENK